MRLTRGHIVYLHDIAMAALSFALALSLRLGDEVWRMANIGTLLSGSALFALVAAVVFWRRKLYGGVWRYASTSDLIAITKAATLACLVFIPVMFLATRLEGLPRSVLVINWFVLMALLGAPRFAYRLFRDRRIDFSPGSPSRIPVMLVGAGDAADLFIRAMQRARDAQYRVVGIVAENGNRVGRAIHGVEVLGLVEDLEAAIARIASREDHPRRLILTKDDMDGAKVRRLLDAADALGMTLARLPKLTEFKDGIADKIDVRPIAIEDLLGRPQAVLDRDSMRALINGRRVLVTGAGGTIGGELVRQIADFGPAELCLLDNGEFNLYGIDLEMNERFPALTRRAIICDVRDAEAVRRAFTQSMPELVFHAAALKHVPMVEGNPLEGILTNACGTRAVADACRAARVSAMVQISTDKAVNPTNVMGATKRIAESYCQALDVAGGTHFITVRFGNVLGSTGSVVPLFQRQLAQGGPLTVTHPDVMRYFMTVREAVELVLEASALGARDESYKGKIFVLDMGEPIRIADLARQMIRLAGLVPDRDVKIAFTGLRPGEKLFEEIFHGAEPPVETPLKGVLVASPRTGDAALLARTIDELDAAARQGQETRALDLLSRLVPEYRTPDHHAAEGLPVRLSAAKD